MSTPRGRIRSDFSPTNEIKTLSCKENLNLCDEAGFRDTMQRLTDELVEKTERMIADGAVSDYSHIKEIWLGKSWDAYMKQFGIEEMCNASI
jgi:hypothetical protein